MPTRLPKIPGVRRFKEEVATVIDPVIDPRKRHQSVVDGIEPEADIEIEPRVARGSCEFEAQEPTFLFEELSGDILVEEYTVDKDRDPTIPIPMDLFEESKF